MCLAADSRFVIAPHRIEVLTLEPGVVQHHADITNDLSKTEESHGRDGKADAIRKLRTLTAAVLPTDAASGVAGPDTATAKTTQTKSKETPETILRDSAIRPPELGRIQPQPKGEDKTGRTKSWGPIPVPHSRMRRFPFDQTLYR
jgi:hypothetical protein